MKRLTYKPHHMLKWRVFGHQRSDFIFIRAFPLGTVGGVSSPKRTRNTSASTAISDNSVTPHQDGTKQGRKSNQSTWSVDYIWTAFPWV